MTTSEQKSLFTLCCIALTVTAMTFAIRAGILSQLGVDFGLSDVQLGWVNAMAFLGFPVATIFGGFLYNALGPRNLITIAFLCHVIGLLLTITASGVWGLLISTFFIGFANGAVEAGCNPLIAHMYKTQKVTMLNKFHVWFPGGIVIGALLSQLMTAYHYPWQAQVAIILIPTAFYGYLLLKSIFPVTKVQTHSVTQNLKQLFTPLYFFLLVCMTLTATTELGTQQWIERILGASGVAPMTILALITGLMAVGRYYAGPIVHKLNPVGVLVVSAVLASSGIYLMSTVQGNAIYVAAILFALGCTYFWPTMLGCVAVYTPKTGALGLSIMGGAGMFAVSIWNPIIGHWIDQARHTAQNTVDPTQIDIVTGQTVLSHLLSFPLVLIVAFAFLYWWLIIKNSQTSNKYQSHDQRLSS